MLSKEQNDVLTRLDQAAQNTGESIFMRIFNSMAKQAIFEGDKCREAVGLDEATLAALVHDGYIVEVRPSFYRVVSTRRK